MSCVYFFPERYSERRQLIFAGKTWCHGKYVGFRRYKCDWKIDTGEFHLPVDTRSLASLSPDIPQLINKGLHKEFVCFNNCTPFAYIEDPPHLYFRIHLPLFYSPEGLLYPRLRLRTRSIKIRYTSTARIILPSRVRGVRYTYKPYLITTDCGCNGSAPMLYDVANARKILTYKLSAEYKNFFYTEAYDFRAGRCRSKCVTLINVKTFEERDNLFGISNPPSTPRWFYYLPACRKRYITYRAYFLDLPLPCTHIIDDTSKYIYAYGSSYLLKIAYVKAYKVGLCPAIRVRFSSWRKEYEALRATRSAQKPIDIYPNVDIVNMHEPKQLSSSPYVPTTSFPLLQRYDAIVKLLKTVARLENR